MRRSGILLCVSALVIISSAAQAEGFGSFSSALDAAAKTATAVQNAAGADASPVVDHAVKAVKGAADTSKSVDNADVAGTISNADKTATAAGDLVAVAVPTEPVTLQDGREVNLNSRNKKDLKAENCPANVHEYKPMALGTLGGFCQNIIAPPGDQNYKPASANVSSKETPAAVVGTESKTATTTGLTSTGEIGGEHGYKNCPGDIVAPSHSIGAKAWRKWQLTPEGKCWMMQKTRTYAE